jgi:nitrogen fixation protein FixH
MADKDMKGMPGMSSMPGMAGMGDPTREGNNADLAGKGQGMDTPAPPVQEAGKTLMHESMTNMPMAKLKRIWTVTGTEDWDMLRGFGAASGMVAMMNSMMVGGSPMRSMKMGKMDMAMTEMPAPTPEEARLASDTTSAPAEASAPTSDKIAAAVTPNPPVVGDNTLDMTVTDVSGKPLTGLKLDATVAMVTMDMGTAHPQVVEIGGGKYRATANFSMAGPWHVVVQGDGGKIKESFDFQAGGTASQSSPAEVQPQARQETQPPAPGPNPAGPTAIAAALTPNPPKVGSPNTLTVTVTDAAGKPVAGAKVTSSVAMTIMDMGTTHPAFKDMGGGKYEGKVGFSMAGPWRVSVKVTPPGQKPQTKAFDFTAK